MGVKTSLDPRCAIDSSPVGTGSAVEVTGILDWHSAPLLRSTLSSLPAGGRVLIDLSRVTRIDSAGTGELIAATVRARHRGVATAILSGTDTADILEQVGLGDSTLVFRDRDSAYRWVTDDEAGHLTGR